MVENVFVDLWVIMSVAVRTRTVAHVVKTNGPSVRVRHSSQFEC